MDMDPPSGGEASLLSRAPKALAWSFGNTVVARFGTVGIGIALARIIGPKGFGTYAIALLALVAALSFNELGVSLAIVRWRTDPRQIAATVNTISIGASALIAAVGFALAPTFAAAMGQPHAAPVVQVLCVSVLISGAAASPAALLQREFQQGKRMAADQVNIWLGAGCSLILAILGLGAMSLAIGRVLGASASLVMFLRFSPEPFRLAFDRQYVRPLLHFGLPLAGASIIVFVISYADQLVTGSVLGPTALGFYLLAFNLASWPQQIFSQPLRMVAPATFARLQHEPERMRSAFRSIAGLLAAVTFPVCLLLAGAAEPLVRFVYGSAWMPAASALAWLGVLAAFRILFELAYDYLVVVGVSRSILSLQLATMVVLVPALIAGAHRFGIAGVAAAEVAVAACVALPLYLLLFRRAGVSAVKLLSRLCVPVLIAAGVGAAAFTLAGAVSSDIAAVVLAGIVALIALGGLIYRDRGQLQLLRVGVLAGGGAGPTEMAP
jgi:O-antigen/teichoic acid export membrane protein